METAPNSRHEYAVYGLLPLFFVSGATALVYQTIWARELHLVFGTSTFAIATVLAAFMAGLALGGAWMARMGDNAARPLRAYGFLEIGIGLYSFAFPLMVRLVGPIYLTVWQSLQPGPVLFGLIQFVLVGGLLLVPTALMGATLPLLARFATERLGSAGDRVGTLYAVNTAGAVFGTWLAGFILLPFLGKHVTTLAVTSANVLLGIAAIALDRWAGGGRVRAANDLPPLRAPRTLGPVALTMGLAGFASLVYEVAWTRLMALMLGASVYAFSTMLLAFLVGIAIGGKVGGMAADRLLKRGGLPAVLLALAALEIGVAGTSYALMYIFPEIPFWYVWLFDWIGAEDNPSMMWVLSTMIAALVMTPPALLMGAAFPVAVRAVIGREDELAAPVGQIYAANTLGGVFGAFLAGFVLLPGVMVQGTIFVAALTNLAAAGICMLQASRAGGYSRVVLLAPIPAVALVFAFVAQRPPWDPLLMTAGMYHYVSHFDDHSKEGIEEFSVGAYKLLYYAEGLSSVVTVAQNETSENIWLANNGKVDASTTTDMPTQVMCALLPMQFVQDPDDVLVIGLASGITAGAVTLVPDVDKLDVVELEPAIREASSYFKEYNHDVLADPRVNLILNDGRNHVYLSPEHSYDVIVSEPPNPWITGVSNLFTKEFLELGKSRLKPGGVWSQWVQMYGMDTDDLRTLIRTFTEVYPHIVLYATIEDADLVLVGSESPLVPTVATAEHLLGWPKVREELKVVEMDEALDIVALYQMDRDRMREMAGPGPFNTDDSMIIEYSAPMNLHKETQEPNFELLLDYGQIPPTGLDPDPDLWRNLARVYREKDDYGRGIAAMLKAISLLPAEDPRVEEWKAVARKWRRLAKEEAGEEPEPEPTPEPAPVSGVGTADPPL
jgi:spermidine synthase